MYQEYAGSMAGVAGTWACPAVGVGEEVGEEGPASQGRAEVVVQEYEASTVEHTSLLEEEGIGTRREQELNKII